MKFNVRHWRRTHRGAPLTRVLFNAMGSGPATTAAKSRRIMAAALQGAIRHPSVLAGVECQALVDGLDPKAWQVIHSSEPDKAGLLFALDRGRGRVLSHRYTMGTPRHLGRFVAKAMRNRLVLEVRYIVDEAHPWAHVYTDAVMHLPPKRNWIPFWAHMMGNVRQIQADFLAADWNRDAPAVLRVLTGRRASMDGIIGWVSRWRYPVSGRSYQVGADHPAYELTTWPGAR